MGIAYPMYSVCFKFIFTELIIYFSCKKDSGSTANPTFSAKVQGTLWKGATIAALHSTGGNTTQIIAAGTYPSEQISLIYIGSGKGTFTFNDQNMGSAVVGSYTFSSMFSDSPEGTITITQYDVNGKKISGTFSFKGDDIDGATYNVTEGKFDNVSLAVQ